MNSATAAALVGFAHVLLAIVVSAHIVLTKPDVRAAIGWVGLIWFVPVAGSLLYGLFGINRIRRQAGRMRRGRVFSWTETFGPASLPRYEAQLPDGLASDLRPLAMVVGAMTGAPLLAGNDLDLLVNGDEAYPAMLSAIDGAQKSVVLATYIFDHGRVADRFLEALTGAVRRGVEVRVLIDGVGARYSHPPILAALRGRGIVVKSFLPPFLSLRHPYFNLRNHRKILVVDGMTAFCGGLNILDGCLLSLNAPDSTQDVHFRIRGPVVEQISRAVVFDWAFTTGEHLEGPRWFPKLEPAGAMLVRGIADGPDENYEALLLTLLGAIAQAKQSVRIATPYFLPDPSLIDALRVAALKGVRVDIVLPEHGNLRLVQWAATAQLDQIVRFGCRVFLSPPPFDHTKLLIVDDTWSLIGSANWDPRSLRLNFEYNLECYSAEFGRRLGTLFDAKMASARQLTVGELEGRSLLIRLRDGVVRLAQPYL